MSENFCISERSGGRAGRLSVGVVTGIVVAKARAWLVSAGWSAATGRDRGIGIAGEAGVGGVGST
ncbi:hypothetical protein, partial [Bradyrhizobium sp.]|uniref:hypothetical protein n=1 Tax=Bradyrhizobium sp. TaxID=376 RepID=UPI003C5D83D7